MRIGNGTTGDIKEFAIQYSDAKDPLIMKELAPTDGITTVDSQGVRVFRFKKLITVIEIRVVVKSFLIHPAFKCEFFRTKGQVSPGTFVFGEDETLIPGGALVSSGTQPSFENYALSSDNGWKSSTNKTDSFVGLQYSKAVYVWAVRIVGGESSSLTLRYYEASNSTVFKTVTLSADLATVEANGVRLFRLWLLKPVFRIEIVFNKFTVWPAIKFNFFSINDVETISQSGKLISSGTLKGADSYSISSKSGWKASQNKTGVWAGIAFQVPTNISGLKIANCTGVLGGDQTNFTLYSRKDNMSTFEQIKPSFISETNGVRLYRFNSLVALETKIVANNYATEPGFRFDFVDTIKTYQFTNTFSANTIIKGINLTVTGSSAPEVIIEYKNTSIPDANAATAAYTCYAGCKAFKLAQPIGNTYVLPFSPLIETKDLRITVRAVNKPERPILSR